MILEVVLRAYNLIDIAQHQHIVSIKTTMILEVVLRAYNHIDIVQHQHIVSIKTTKNHLITTTNTSTLSRTTQQRCF